MTVVEPAMRIRCRLSFFRRVKINKTSRHVVNKPLRARSAFDLFAEQTSEQGERTAIVADAVESVSRTRAPAPRPCSSERLTNSRMLRIACADAH